MMTMTMTMTNLHLTSVLQTGTLAHRAIITKHIVQGIKSSQHMTKTKSLTNTQYDREIKIYIIFMHIYNVIVI